MGVVTVVKGGCGDGGKVFLLGGTCKVGMVRVVRWVWGGW